MKTDIFFLGVMAAFLAILAALSAASGWARSAWGRVARPHPGFEGGERRRIYPSPHFGRLP